MQAYRGDEGLRLFRSIAAEDLTDPGEVLASMHCLCVEFISRKELKRQDRELLAALGHPQGRGLASPDCGDMLAMTFGATPIPKTREEALVEEIAAQRDPIEAHFMRVRETERREKAAHPLNYWE